MSRYWPAFPAQEFIAKEQQAWIIAGNIYLRLEERQQTTTEFNMSSGCLMNESQSHIVGSLSYITHTHMKQSQKYYAGGVPFTCMYVCMYCGCSYLELRVRTEQQQPKKKGEARQDSSNRVSVQYVIHIKTTTVVFSLISKRRNETRTRSAVGGGV